MSDLATIAQDSPGGRDLECLASPRKKVTELREEWARAGNGKEEGDGLSNGKASEVKRWIRELDKLPVSRNRGTSVTLLIMTTLFSRRVPSNGLVRTMVPELKTDSDFTSTLTM
jgi:hypothetical protein